MNNKFRIKLFVAILMLLIIMFLRWYLVDVKSVFELSAFGHIFFLIVITIGSFSGGILVGKQKSR